MAVAFEAKKGRINRKNKGKKKGERATYVAVNRNRIHHLCAVPMEIFHCLPCREAYISHLR